MDARLAEALKVLGIPAGSDRQTVHSAYRRLAWATHPDVSADPDAADRFADVLAAYRLVTGMPESAPRPRLHASGRPAFTVSFLRQPAPRPHSVEPEDFHGNGSVAVWGPSGARPLLGAWPVMLAGTSRRPPIVAGPAVIRTRHPDPGCGRRDG